MTIREFQPGDETAFRDLNVEWLTRYFTIEAKDESVFDDPARNIIARGGRLFFAVDEGRPVGCCALIATVPGEFEVGKMAVTAACQGRGLGRKLLEAAIDCARSLGAHRLYLETNHILSPAIRLYESVGFRHLPPERVQPSAYARADVYMEMMLG